MRKSGFDNKPAPSEFRFRCQATSRAGRLIFLAAIRIRRWLFIPIPVRAMDRAIQLATNRAASDVKPVQLEGRDSLDMRVATSHGKLSGEAPASIWFSSSPPFWNVHGWLSRMTRDTSHSISEAEVLATHSEANNLAATGMTPCTAVESRGTATSCLPSPCSIATCCILDLGHESFANESFSCETEDGRLGFIVQQKSDPLSAWNHAETNHKACKNPVTAGLHSF